MVDRHIFKPVPRAMPELSTPPPPIPEPKPAKLLAFPMLIGMLSLLLSLVPVCIGMNEFQGVEKPLGLPLAKFDALFRKAGSLLPFIPLTLRCLVQLQGKKNEGKVPSIFGIIPGVALHFTIQAVRLALYGLHVSGQKRGIVAGHFFADHCVLGIAVQSGLAFEIAAALYQLAAAKAGAVAAIAYGLCETSALIFIALVSFDMKDTAKYFHEVQESLVGVAVGVLVFALPVWYILITAMLQQKSSLQNGKKAT